MKSRYDFGTDDQYYEYLVHYYTGCITTGMHSSPALLEACTSDELLGETYPDRAAEISVRYAKAIVERIKKGV